MEQKVAEVLQRSDESVYQISRYTLNLSNASTLEDKTNKQLNSVSSLLHNFVIQIANIIQDVAKNYGTETVSKFVTSKVGCWMKCEDGKSGQVLAKEMGSKSATKWIRSIGNIRSTILMLAERWAALSDVIKHPERIDDLLAIDE